jgi:hypothetical protein
MRDLRPWVIGFVVLTGLSRTARADRIDDLVRTYESSSSYKVRVQICAVLGKTGDRRAVPLLIQATHDDNSVIRLAAAQALGRIGDPEALAALRELVRAGTSGVAETAQRSIASIEHAGAASAAPPGPAVGGGRLFISVGPLAGRTHSGTPEAIKVFRAELVRALGKLPGVQVGGTQQRGQAGYYVDGNIVRLTTEPQGSHADLSCDLKLLVASYPQKSILMMTDGGATVQIGTGPSDEQRGTHDCLEAAVQGVMENVQTYFAAQLSAERTQAAAPR